MAICEQVIKESIRATEPSNLPEKQLIAMGCQSAMELKRSYTSFSGTDVRFYLDGEVLGSMQAGSIHADLQGVHGTIIILRLEGAFPFYPGMRFSTLEGVAANEYGKVAVVWAVKNGRILDYMTGVSVDDIVIEERYTFEAELVLPQDHPEVIARWRGRAIH